MDAGHTQGYKKKQLQNLWVQKSHFFSRFEMKGLIDEEDKNSNLEIKLEKVTNDTYLKVYDIETAFIDKDINVLENTLNYDYQDEDLFLEQLLALDNLTKQDRSNMNTWFPI